MNDIDLTAIIVPGTDPEIVAAYSTLAARAVDAEFGFEDEVAVLDIETTGYDPECDRIIEIAAAVMQGSRVISRFSTLVNPMVPVPAEITALTGITTEMVADGPSVEAAVSQLKDFVGKRDIVAHNAPFDRSFIERVAGRGSLPGFWLDSLPLSRIAMPRLRTHRLADLASAFGVGQGVAHRAMADVDALAGIWRVALVGLSDLPPGILERIVTFAPETDWPLRQVLARVAGARRPAPFDLKELRRLRVAADKAETLDDADDVACVVPDAAEVALEFSAGGLAGRMYEGFEERAEQVDMARAVVEAFDNRKHVAIEAGTGVGKSIAYLVPASRFSLENRVGVGIATKTNALMDQLVYHELPRLNAALDGELRYVALKGYDHYPCLRKMERMTEQLDAGDVERIESAAMLIAWVAQSAWGDLDAINLHWQSDVRASIQSSQADCIHKRCRFFPQLCYLHGVRRRAASANIVVTNHALLFRDVVAQGAVLPPIRHWIVDEAHAAESEARKQLTMGASQAEMGIVLAALHGKRAGLLENVRKKIGADEAGAGPLGVIARMEERVLRCATLSESLFDFVKDLAPLAGDSEYDSAELWLTPAVRETGPWGTIAATGGSLAKRLAELLADGRELVTLLEEWGADTVEARADLAGLLSRLADQHAGLVAVIDGEDDTMVYSAELDRRRQVISEKLVAARLDIGEALLEDLYPRVQSVVYTSATIATGESFEHFARSVGLDRLPPGSWSSLRLASSYDFERQMAVFVPTDLPLPKEAGYLRSLEGLLEGVHRSMDGSVLTLFTNRRDMERLFSALEPRLRADGLPLIMQRRGTSAKRLRDEFIADEKLSLFALKSFWEGFDAKGDTLRCVVIPKLPFSRPSDPLTCEREAREGRVAWRRYVLPEAVIELKQAAGRLIRSSTDTGCLVIADARVSRMEYGRAFLEALPVDDVERVTSDEALERIAERFGR